MRAITPSHRDVNRLSTTSIQFRHRRPAFSLLEVILSTAILSAASIVLYSTFTLGDKQGREASQILQAQLLCQSTLDELLAQPARIEIAESMPFETHPEWTYSISWSPTELENLIALTIRVAPNTALTTLPTGSAATPAGLANSAGPASAGNSEQSEQAGNESASTSLPVGERSDPRAVTMVRWLHIPPGLLEAGSHADSGGRDQAPLGSRTSSETGNGNGSESSPSSSSSGSAQGDPPGGLP